MKPKLILCLALVLSGGLFGCSSVRKIYPPNDDLFGSHIFTVPREFKNGTATLTNVYAWSESLLGSRKPLETRYKDIDLDGQDELLVRQPSNAGTGGNEYFILKKMPKGYRFLGDLWFGGLETISPDSQGRPRLITFSHLSSGSGRVALCYLDRDGFHESMGRILAYGDGPHGAGKDWLMDRATDYESGKPKNITEPMVQLIFGDPATIEFSGSIKAGKRFERPFGDRFIFALEPIEHGWEISVYEKGRKEDLAELTLPLHGPNSTDIEGWHFRNEDNTGSSNDAAIGNDIREFIFSPEVGKVINASGSSNDITEDDFDRIQAFGQGELKITQLKLSPPQLHGTAIIEKMNFDCKLTWRRKNLESLYSVRQGDTLAKIAKLSGMTVKELDAVNPQMAAKHAPGSQPVFQPAVGEQLLIYSPTQ
jgi:hypothetical protein